MSENDRGSEHDGAGGSAVQLSAVRKYSETVVPLVALACVSSVVGVLDDELMAVLRAPAAVVAYVTSVSVSPQPVPLNAVEVAYIVSVMDLLVFTVNDSGNAVSW